jgi:hypothetical protein
MNKSKTELRIPAKDMTRQPQASKASPVKIDEAMK